uniref:DNA-binding protein RAV1 n=1 Tax=Rhizophora mucronata TaxID=61149 RepID=A0A2P2L950_RHIMU
MFNLASRNRSKMEGEIQSKITNEETSVVEVVSDSNSVTRLSPLHKRASCRSSIGSSRFKGVVPQQNGHWGCQIYANHQRIWLGTFKCEKEAAMAYDSASIKLRRRDGHRNFPVTSITVEESKFQSHYSVEAVLHMIKDGTYWSKFEEFVRCQVNRMETDLCLNLAKAHNHRGLTCQQLFQKELTPSDVGNLNRLVIPKKFATRFFPCLPAGIEDNAAAVKLEDVQLEFYDRSMKLWKFRYCYWTSSQSYVFTRGWNRFVKDKKLKATDTIAFCLCECRENGKAIQTFYMIDVNNGDNQIAEMEVGLQLQPGKCTMNANSFEKKMQGEGLIGGNATDAEERKGFKLFGVQII